MYSTNVAHTDAPSFYLKMPHVPDNSSHRRHHCVLWADVLLQMVYYKLIENVPTAVVHFAIDGVAERARRTRPSALGPAVDPVRPMQPLGIEEIEDVVEIQGLRVCAATSAALDAPLINPYWHVIALREVDGWGELGFEECFVEDHHVVAMGLAAAGDFLGGVAAARRLTVDYGLVAATDPDVGFKEIHGIHDGTAFEDVLRLQIVAVIKGSRTNKTNSSGILCPHGVASIDMERVN